jgi:hypothetical protein
MMTEQERALATEAAREAITVLIAHESFYGQSDPSEGNQAAAATDTELSLGIDGGRKSRNPMEGGR